MSKIFFNSFGMIFCFVKPLLFILIFILCVWFLFAIMWYLYFVFIKHIKPIKSINNIPLLRNSIVKRLFIDAPRQFILDIITQNPYYFNEYGLIIFEGRQGQGKTSSMVHYLNQLKIKHPYCEILTNFDYVYQDAPLLHWSQLLDYENATSLQAGVVASIDEMQNWFSSKESKDFSVDMLSIITQNRKNRRLICGTAQQFYMLAKDIRTQCTEVRSCRTFLGCVTFVHKKEPVIDSEGNVTKWINRGFYFWVHNDKIRNSYDTLKTIDYLKKAGFENKNQSLF